MSSISAISSGVNAENESSAIQILSRYAPKTRGWFASSNGTSFATGLPASAMMITSPARTRFTSFENWVFAS